MRISHSPKYLSSSWDSLPIIQTYVKQKLGDAPAPVPKEIVVKPTVESPTMPMPKPVLAASTVASAVEGERWDPNRSLDKLKTGVIHKLLEQQQQQQQQQEKRSETVPEAPASEGDMNRAVEGSPPDLLVDDGN
jgi:hypothetical protein